MSTEYPRASTAPLAPLLAMVAALTVQPGASHGQTMPLQRPALDPVDITFTPEWQLRQRVTAEALHAACSGLTENEEVIEELILQLGDRLVRVVLGEEATQRRETAAVLDALKAELQFFEHEVTERYLARLMQKARRLAERAQGDRAFSRNTTRASLTAYREWKVEVYQLEAEAEKALRATESYRGIAPIQTSKSPPRLSLPFRLNSPDPARVRGYLMKEVGGAIQAEVGGLIRCQTGELAEAWAGDFILSRQPVGGKEAGPTSYTDPKEDKGWEDGWHHTTAGDLSVDERLLARDFERHRARIDRLGIRLADAGPYLEQIPDFLQGRIESTSAALTQFGNLHKP